MRPLAVFDTNILFSGTGGWKGSPYQCLQMARAGIVGLVTCAPLLDELEEKLRGKLDFSASRAWKVIAELLTISRLVAITGQLKVVKDDPDDDKVLECAVVGSAGYIVTGDRRHLLPMKSYGAIQIVTPAEFIALVPRLISE
jgi:uncharacterized protein